MNRRATVRERERVASRTPFRRRDHELRAFGERLLGRVGRHGPASVARLHGQTLHKRLHTKTRRARGNVRCIEDLAHAFRANALGRWQTFGRVPQHRVHEGQRAPTHRHVHVDRLKGVILPRTLFHEFAKHVAKFPSDRFARARWRGTKHEAQQTQGSIAACRMHQRFRPSPKPTRTPRRNTAPIAMRRTKPRTRQSIVKLLPTGGMDPPNAGMRASLNFVATQAPTGEPW